MPIPEPLKAALAALDLDPPCHEHPPLATVEDAHAHWDGLAGAQVKNLFLKDAGGQLWLVVMPGDPRVDTKRLAGVIGSKRISFGSAALLGEVLGVMPGSVTPLAVMHDSGLRVRAVLHAPLMAAAALLVHPLVNTATLVMPPGDVVRFMTARHRAPALIDLSGAFLD